MISYGFSIQGKSHIAKEKVCQDSNIVCQLKKNWMLAAVADGVGSAEHSEIGSQIAVESIAEYCNKHFPTKPTEQKLINMLKEGYEYAFECILNYCENSNGIISDYDTTLSTAIYDGRTVVYGHSGDGGIIVRKENGEYEAITERQKGVDGISVIPLRGGADSWVFDVCKENATAVLLATDGILDGVLMPYLLNIDGVSTMEEILEGKKNKVYVTSAELLMNPKCIFKNRKISKPEEFIKHFIEDDEKAPDREKIANCIRNGYEGYFRKRNLSRIVNSIDECGYTKWSIKKVTDDKTVACLINDKAKEVHMPEDYYMEPDWKGLRQKYEMILYPSMHKRKIKSELVEEENDSKEICTKNRGNKKRSANEYKKNISGKKTRRKNKWKLNVKVLRIILETIIFLVVFFMGIQLGKYVANRGTEKESESTTAVMEITTTSVEETTKEVDTTEKDTSKETTNVLETIEEETFEVEETTETIKATKKHNNKEREKYGRIKKKMVNQ